MKRAILILGVMLVSLWVCDRLAGVCYDRLLSDMPDAAMIESDSHEALFHAAPDVLLLGSSRTKHEYVPRMIAASTGMTVYNAGIDGYGMNYSMVVLESVLERHTPRIVVLDVLDAMMSAKWVDCVDQWDCYYGMNDAVTRYIDGHTSWQKRLKMQSHLYRLNGVTTWVAKAYATGTVTHNDGYAPLVGSDPDMRHKRYRGFDIDSTELHCLDRIVSLCAERGVELYVFMSPNWEHNLDFNPWLAAYCREHDVPFKDFTTAFNGRPDLFVEAGHLNEQGAEQYTPMVVKCINHARGMKVALKSLK